MNTVQFNFNNAGKNMKKFVCGICGWMILGIATVKAQEEGIIQRDFLIDEQVAAEVSQKAAAEKNVLNEEDVENAQNQAKKLLKARPQALRKHNFPKLRSQIKTSTVSDKTAAPFGLVWGATINDTRNQGVLLQAVGEKDYVNNFSASHLTKPVKDFARIDVTFGEEDKLWRIIAYGHLLDDDAKATKVLRLYKIYNDLLTKKYGHAQEFFTPALINVEKKDEKGRPVLEQQQAPIGNADFLKQLQSGDAVLYSTYYNDEVGAALAVNVDGDGKSYIVLDYKNLKILRQQESVTLDAL